MNDFQSILEKYNINLSKTSIDNVQWQTQECNSSSILFYKFNKHSNEEVIKFNERISNIKYGICITNNSNICDDKVFGLNQEQFDSFFFETTKSFHPVDQDKFKIFGVTGTNGKTTTVDLLRQILIQQKINVLTIGTLGVYYNDKFIKTFSLTTPSQLDIYKTINEYQDKVDVITVEVSSHALDQGRFGEFKFDDIGWTNLSQDHLDYHVSMDEYFSAKYKIFSYLKTNGNCYVPKGQSELSEKITNKVISVDKNWETDNLFLKPKYNQENMAIAKSLASSIIDTKKIKYENIQAPPGRFNIVNYKNSYVVIDFAHSPDGLLSICSELKSTFPDKKLITLFGCGGDRDRGKRKLMGEVASKFSDKVYITSDNPRFEDPAQIIEDIKTGISCEYESNIDRAQSIKVAMKNLNNSILLIAGKGHENYIDQNGTKVSYNDLEEIKKYLDD